MKREFNIYKILLTLIILLGVGCTRRTDGELTRNLAPQQEAVISAEVQEVKSSAQAFLNDWKQDNLAGMYLRLTSVSKDAISEDEFKDHFNGVSAEAALTGIEYELSSALVDADTAQVGYRITLKSLLVGGITRSTVMNLSKEGEEWRVQWDDTLVLPELEGGNYLYMDRAGYTPSRANIYDRNGHALVAQTDVTAVGLYPDKITPEQEKQVLEMVTELTGLSMESVKQMYSGYPSGAGWYLPLGEISTDAKIDYNKINKLEGLALSPYKSRFYFNGGVAPHVVGYVSAIQPDEVQDYLRLGYSPDERVGRSGLEKWGESYLAGSRGGALYVFNEQDRPLTRLAEAVAEPSQAIHTTLDKEFQTAVEQAVGSFTGAVVVLERDSGRVLALVSSPDFDPNAFEPVNFDSDALLQEILNNPDQPLLNRATQGLYPLGSVFKIITMAAGLESGLYTPDTTYQCGYVFEELEGTKLYDWTYEYFQQDGRTIPSGLLTLPEGLIRSCNPFFWHIGLGLFNQGHEKAVSEMARGFGLGSSTGIVGLEELEGQVLDPASQVDAVNTAIGQGELLVTPLQVANFVAAVGNGGTLYKPQVIEKIAPPDRDPEVVFKKEEIGRLPVTAENLKVIQDAMVGVIRNEKPRGTAWHSFTGLDIPVAGKTGTAQTSSGEPHAWFAGYTYAEQLERPDIAIAVVLENAGEGSVYAAPIFRRIVEIYFGGQPQKLYPWETELNINSDSDQDSIITPVIEPTATPEQ
jgi:penicillin-binding protein 2